MWYYVFQLCKIALSCCEDYSYNNKTLTKYFIFFVFSLCSIWIGYQILWLKWSGFFLYLIVHLDNSKWSDLMVSCQILVLKHNLKFITSQDIGWHLYQLLNWILQQAISGSDWQNKYLYHLALHTVKYYLVFKYRIIFIIALNY